MEPDINTRTTIINLRDITDFDEDDNAPSLADVPDEPDELEDSEEPEESDEPEVDEQEEILENFIDEVIETVDAYLWTANAIVPHKSAIDGDEINDMATVFTKFEKEELFGEIYSLFQLWFNN